MAVTTVEVGMFIIKLLQDSSLSSVCLYVCVVEHKQLLSPQKHHQPRSSRSSPPHCITATVPSRYITHKSKFWTVVNWTCFSLLKTFHL